MPVLIAEKDFLPIVTPLRHMPPNSGNHYRRYPYHTPTLTHPLLRQQEKTVTVPTFFVCMQKQGTDPNCCHMIVPNSSTFSGFDMAEASSRNDTKVPFLFFSHPYVSPCSHDSGGTTHFAGVKAGRRLRSGWDRTRPVWRYRRAAVSSITSS